MNNQRIEFRIGVVVLVALATLVFMVVWFGKQSIISFGDEYTVKVRFQATPGVKVNTPVIKNGVQVGRVSKIELVDEDREVEVSILLPKDRRIYTNEECRVRQTMIMGDSTLEFVKIKKFTGEVSVIPYDGPPLVGGSALDLVSGFSNIESDLQKAITNVSHTAETMTTFIERVNTFIGSPEELKKRQEELQASMREMIDTMRSVRRLSDGAGNIFNDPQFQANTKKIVNDLPGILDRSRLLLSDSESFLKEFRASVARGTATLDKFDRGIDLFNDGMTEIRPFMKQLGNDGPETLASLRSATKKIDSIVGDVSSILAGISSSETPLMQRFLQPEVAENLTATIQNVRSITEQFDLLLKNDVKPITNNVKIITDKVARDPSVFIRNLLKKQPPIKNGIPVWGDGLGSDSLSVDCFDLGPFREGTIHYEEGTIIEQSTPEPTLAPPLARQRPATITERIASIFSVPKSTAVHSKSAPKIPVVEQIVEESQVSEPVVFEEQPLALELPKLEPPRLPEHDEIPVEGRIVCVDPRYAGVETPTPYRQMSYSAESNPTPKLVFTRSK